MPVRSIKLHNRLVERFFTRNEHHYPDFVSEKNCKSDFCVVLCQKVNALALQRSSITWHEVIYVS